MVKFRLTCPTHIYLVLYNCVTRISAQTLCWNFKLFYEVNQKRCLLLFFSIPRHAKRKPRVVAKLFVNRCVLCRANFNFLRANHILHSKHLAKRVSVVLRLDPFAHKYYIWNCIVLVTFNTIFNLVISLNQNQKKKKKKMNLCRVLIRFITA